MLKSLQIKNFRSLKAFDVPRLGQINLIVGKNNSGKSTVLEALRIFAGNANRKLLETIAREHNEKVGFVVGDTHEDEPLLPFESFFTGREYPQEENVEIFIGESSEDLNALRIRHGFLKETEEAFVAEDGETVTRTVRTPISRAELATLPDGIISQALFIGKGDRQYRLRFDVPFSRVASTINDIPLTIPCSIVPTQFVTIDELAEEWDKIVLTEYQHFIRDALKIVESGIVDLAFVKETDRIPSRRDSRSAKVKLEAVKRPVPLNSMGDGMIRILQLVLKIFPAKGGFLLIDEFENGLHYSVQKKVWSLVFDLAKLLNIQVFATTHSWDCIESFSAVAIEKSEIDGILFRVGTSVRSSDRNNVIATIFDEAQLKGITQADVEVR